MPKKNLEKSRNKQATKVTWT